MSKKTPDLSERTSIQKRSILDEAFEAGTVIQQGMLPELPKPPREQAAPTPTPIPTPPPVQQRASPLPPKPAEFKIKEESQFPLKQESRVDINVSEDSQAFAIVRPEVESHEEPADEEAFAEDTHDADQDVEKKPRRKLTLSNKIRIPLALACAAVFGYLFLNHSAPETRGVASNGGFRPTVQPALPPAAAPAAPVIAPPPPAQVVPPPPPTRMQGRMTAPVPQQMATNVQSVVDEFDRAFTRTQDQINNR